MLYEMTQKCPFLFGVGAIQEVGNRVKAQGATKVLVVCDPVLKGIGYPEKLIKIIEAAGVKTVVWDKIKADAPDYLVDEGGEFARKEKIDGVVTIGGGSTLDIASGIALLATNPGSVRDYMMVRSGLNLVGDTLAATRQIPLVAIPTTAGTGTEASACAVITDTESSYKDTIFGVENTLAILDPEILVTLPPYVTASTAMDAFAHAAEGLTSVLCSPRVELLDLDAIAKIAKWLPVAVKDGSNLEARSNLLLASNFAGMAMGDAFGNIGHAIAHTLGKEYHVDHGTACGLSIAADLAYVAVAVPEMVKKIGLAMGLAFKGDETPEEIGQIVADGVRALMKECGIKALKDYGLTREQVLSTIPAGTKKEQMLRDLCARQPLTDEDIDAMVAEVYDKYL